MLNGQTYWKAVARYYRWAWDHAPEICRLLDPVVSVHPDGVIFEVFSQDESSYGRVTVPMEELECFGDTQLWHDERGLLAAPGR